jgi:(p)ppGpp synthase/HD superfamily hydrolase
MLSTGRLHHAIAIAEEAHKGQVDKRGRPYITHCERVADAQSGTDEKIIAYLHDVIEKGEGWTLTRLAGEGFSDDVIVAVDALSRRMGEGQEAFFHRTTANPLARPVKKADLEDHIAEAKAMGGDAQQYERDLQLLV